LGKTPSFARSCEALEGTSSLAVIRTIAWIALVCGLLIFSFYNWRPVEVTIWENLVLETKVPVLMVLAFLIGFVPMMAYHLSVVWG
jgi:lipopolysaccharide assembly protein A